jgi:hypothetical protein
MSDTHVSDTMTLPPSFTVSPTVVGVSVFTPEGATVQVSLPRPRGLRELPQDEIVERAQHLARAALEAAAASLAH